MAEDHPGDGNAERLHEYWVHGEGAAKIRWGTPGAHTRCHAQLMEHAHMTSDQAWGYCQLAGHAATGKWSGEKGPLDKALHGRTGKVTVYERSFPLEDIKLRADGDGRTVEAYAAVFDTPTEVKDQDGHYLEVIDRAAFDRALAKAAPTANRGWRIGVFYNHGKTIDGTPSERHSMPIGVPLEIRVEPRGLLTVTRYHRSELADEVLENIREGSLSRYSFSGRFDRSNPVIPPGRFGPDRKRQLRTVTRLESTLREYGPTPFPVYDGAEVVGMRAEQAALLLSTLSPGEYERLAAIIRAGAPAVRSEDSPDADAPPDGGLVAEDSRPQQGETRSGRPLSPREELQARRVKFLIQHGGGRIGA